MSTKSIIQSFSFLVVTSVIGLLLAGSSLFMASTHALSVNSARDCDNNAVIRCGALSTNELQQKYTNNPSVHVIFSYFGINKQEINAMSSTAVAGKVTRDGKVLVNGKTVATNAKTAGRQGSGKQVTKNGVTFFVRSPSNPSSFQSDSLKAFVVMKNNKFVFAVIASCGNPVIGTPVKPPKQPIPPAPSKPQKPKPQPKPRPAPPVVQQQQQQQTATANATANVTINEAEKTEPTNPEVVTVAQPIPVTGAEESTAEAVPEELPKSGLELTSSTIGIIAVIGTIATLGHFLYIRRSSY